MGSPEMHGCGSMKRLSRFKRRIEKPPDPLCRSCQGSGILSCPSTVPCHLKQPCPRCFLLDRDDNFSCHYCEGSGRSVCFRCTGLGITPCLRCLGTGHRECSCTYEFISRFRRRIEKPADPLCSSCQGVGVLCCPKIASCPPVQLCVCLGAGWMCRLCMDRGLITCSRCRGQGGSTTCRKCQGTGERTCSCAFRL